MADAKCRKCLLRDVSPEDYRRYVESILLRLSPREKAPDGLYAARLSQCAACGQLNGGTCMGCGCLVELRAAYQKQKCPFGKWQS